MNRRLRYGMVGGGSGAFFGPVHRRAASLDDMAEFIAGALSSTPERSIESGRELGLSADRNYPTWEAMLEGELARSEDDRIDFVSIVTPNHTHFAIARAFAEAGFDVVLDKPMTTTLDDAEELVRAAERAGVVLCVTYTFVGYPMVREARRIARSGELGAVRRIEASFRQGWLSTRIEAGGQKQASWRTDPALAGAGALGDIGVHVEMLARWITGLTPGQLCAEVSTHVSGRMADDDATVLLRYENGARGLLVASQVCAGEECAIDVRVFGERGGVVWSHDDSNQLIRFHHDGAKQILTRAGAGASPEAAIGARLPAGHPEGFTAALANVYRGAMLAMRARRDGQTPEGLAADYPSVRDGADGVRFVHRSLVSAASGGVWVDW
ncbi:MAG: Gfo/Idh/MocA family oxidoreductase [Planctomycetota bacterium]